MLSYMFMKHVHKTITWPSTDAPYLFTFCLVWMSNSLPSRKLHLCSLTPLACRPWNYNYIVWLKWELDKYLFKSIHTYHVNLHLSCFRATEYFNESNTLFPVVQFSLFFSLTNLETKGAKWIHLFNYSGQKWKKMVKLPLHNSIFLLYNIWSIKSCDPFW